MKELALGGRRITLVEGDITDQDTDAVVNAANSGLWMGSGVAGAIKKKGGQQIEDEAIAQGPIPIGEAVATGAGNLKARYVIHAAGMGPNLVTDEDKIRQSTRNALLRAHELGLGSISLPSIGTGVGGFGLSHCAETMLAEAKAFLTEHETSISEVRFVLWGREAYSRFVEVLESMT